MARLTWVLAVAWLMVRAVAMSVLLRPCATSPTISLLAGGELGQGVPSRAAGLASVSARRAISRRVSPGRQEGLAAGDDADAVQELAGFGVLDQEAGGAGAERFDDVLVVIEGGEDEHVHVGEVGVGGDLAGGAQPVDAGHPDVHEHDVGVGLSGQFHRSGSVAGFADHDHAGLGVDEYPEAGSDEGFVVGDEHPDGLGHRSASCVWRIAGHHCGFGTGSSASTSKPPSGCGAAVSRPDNARARSRIPSMP